MTSSGIWLKPVRTLKTLPFCEKRTNLNGLPIHLRDKNMNLYFFQNNSFSSLSPPMAVTENEFWKKFGRRSLFKLRYCINCGWNKAKKENFMKLGQGFALENALFRKVVPELMQKNVNLEKFCKASILKTRFLRGCAWNKAKKDEFKLNPGKGSLFKPCFSKSCAWSNAKKGKF